MKKIRSLKGLSLLLFFLFVIISPASSQNQIRIMTYNLLNYPGSDSNVRKPYFRTVIAAANPDVIVVSEMAESFGVNSFLNSVLNYDSVTYSSGFFINGPDSDNAIFYKTSKINFIFNTAIPTQLRNINEFKISDKVYKDTLRIYAVHLKADNMSANERAAEVDSLRKRTNLLPAGSDFIVLGDFNIYGSNEPAYQKLLADNVTDDGNFNDPFTLTGTWNSFAYRQYHTQSTRTRSFGNGATGGLDDRFDMILYSNGVKNGGGIKFIPGTYVPFGNDGNHYNDSINEMPNNAVPQSVANALHYASDHLPVYATFEFGSATNLNVKIMPEGFYNTALNNLTRRDTLKIYLHNSVSPYTTVDSSISVLDSNTLTAGFVFRNAPNGNYYIDVRHLNSIETWSKSGGLPFYIDSLMSYDFTTSQTQGFGNNLVLKGTKYCMYGGDVDQDGVVDLGDIIETFNDAESFASGYLKTDVNGDYITDISDIVLVYNNASSFVSRVVP